MVDWARLSVEVLGISHADLPLILVIGEECVWRISHADEQSASQKGQASIRREWGGNRFRVDGEAHSGSVELPNGKVVPSNPIALTSVGNDSRRPFFVIASLPVWRRVIPPDRAVEVESLVSGIALHELIHSIQIVWAHDRLGTAAEKLGSSIQVDDDMFQEIFSGNPAYEAAFLEERSALIDAIKAEDADEKLQLTRVAVGLYRARQERFFVDHPDELRLLQDVFLTLEGASVWASFQVRPPDGDASVEGIVDHYSNKLGNWIQDEGILVATLVSQLDPLWVGKVYRPEPALLIDLLEQVIR